MFIQLPDFIDFRFNLLGEHHPVIVHVPHAGTAIPPIHLAGLIASDDEIAEDLARSTDYFVDQLWFPVTARGGMVMTNRLSRLVVDVERFADDRNEPAAARGRGAVYMRTCHGNPLRPDDLPPAEREALIEAVHAPWQATVALMVDHQLEVLERPCCTIIDAHSFPDTPLPCELDPDPSARPDICLGWDEWHTPASFRRPLVELFEGHGLSVLENRPFAGSFVPRKHWRRDRRVRSLMVEVNRRLYWDEEAQDVVAAGVERMRGVLVEAFELVVEMNREVEPVKIRQWTDEDYEKRRHWQIGTLHRGKRKRQEED